jgi:DNA-binding transcriptional regulator YiaG
MTPQDLRLMRKKARVSVYQLARELGLPLDVVRNIEQFPQALPAWADRYVEALTRLTA